MSDEIKVRIRRIIDETWNGGNVDILDEFYQADFVHHRAPFPDFEGLAAYKQYILDTRSAYPDLQLTEHEMIVEGDMGAMRWSFRGTHKGQSPTFPIPPTGKQVVFTGCLVFRLEDDKIVEEWNHNDYLGFLQQLGVVPPLGESGG